MQLIVSIKMSASNLSINEDIWLVPSEYAPERWVRVTFTSRQILATQGSADKERIRACPILKIQEQTPERGHSRRDKSFTQLNEFTTALNPRMLLNPAWALRNLFPGQNSSIIKLGDEVILHTCNG